MSESLIRVNKADLEDFIIRVFLAAGLEENQASIVAKHLVLANMRGVDSHGVSRLDIYTKRLEIGITSRKTELKAVRETDSSMLIDGESGLGIVLCTEGIRIAVEKAKKTGLAVVGIRNSSHCGMLGAYTMYAAQNDCIAIAAANASSSVAPWGGKEAYFGTNPFSYGVPAGKEKNIVFDMATSVVAKGKIRMALVNNQKIPVGWAITKDGKPTTDPREAMDGLLLPVGGPKGYGLNFFVEVLSGLLSGAAFGPYIRNLYKDLDKSQDMGQFLFVMRADLFVPLEEFKKRMDQMIGEIRQISLAEGFDRIYLPGEIEQEKAEERERNGIPLTPETINELKAVGNRYSVTAMF